MEKNNDNLKALNTYIDGKMKRYSLLFSVNGGAFAIIRFSTQNGDLTNFVIGSIRLSFLAIGAIIFTFLIFIDIWAWGSNMRENYNLHDSAFTVKGQMILIGLSSLLVYGWIFGGFYFDPNKRPEKLAALALLFATPLIFYITGTILEATSKKCPQELSDECESDLK